MAPGARGQAAAGARGLAAAGARVLAAGRGVARVGRRSRACRLLRSLRLRLREDQNRRHPHSGGARGASHVLGPLPVSQEVQAYASMMQGHVHHHHLSFAGEQEGVQQRANGFDSSSSMWARAVRKTVNSLNCVIMGFLLHCD
ncbi:hypothetical protein BRADI_4g21641v3 [Brachypodium distachyon]|uniref:Uncharacterized protein n=1 Tax=Brachypodium distachyon TaxID=15368 RepID=A0A2K2CP76_BRADI|nr:hypothetical protein BRADI_4g21641v3 [Brachypodium distachyon]